MSGHGHVTPNANGFKARCGGPAICEECARELAGLATHLVHHSTDLLDWATNLVRHAAQLLEQEAQALKECSTIDGDWRDEVDAKAAYEDMTLTARQLRRLAMTIQAV